MKPKISPDVLRSELAQFIGTEKYYRHMLNTKLLYTDGVQYFAEKVGAYWFLDIVATEPAILQQAETFAAIDLIGLDNQTSIIKVTDGNHRVSFRRQYFPSDVPPGTWRFFFVNDVLMLASEY